jgi:hypothetical protein
MPGLSISVELDSIQGFTAKRGWVAFDLSKARITIGRNGKHYLSLDAIEKKQPDDWGNTHFIKEASTKDERTNKVELPFCGKGKAFGNQQQQRQQTAPQQRSPQKAMQRGGWEKDETANDDSEIPF